MAATISIHAPQWGATQHLISHLRFLLFQSTHPSGVRQLLVMVVDAHRLISIHAPQWGATMSTLIIACRYSYFNPRTPVGCDPTRISARSTSIYFNPRTPVGCDHPVCLVAWARFISIHAPQWGATMKRRNMDTRQVFQSTHPSGVRLRPAAVPAGGWHFNPRTPVGCDRREPPTGRSVRYFNPRTPVGCDYLRRLMRAPHRDFNPRTPVGCDEANGTVTMLGNPFQSTHPSGVRQSVIAVIARISEFQSTHPSGVRLSPPNFPRLPSVYFNPRTPVGCDNPYSTPYDLWLEFQSTHPSGVRPSSSTDYDLSEMISIHAPQWGATSSRWLPVYAATDFNPRTPVGCDGQPAYVLGEIQVFQSTHPSGVRHRSCRLPDHPRDFNPRTPVGCDFPPRPRLNLGVISIHAPQWGATHGLEGNRQRGCISIHAPQWGATARMGIAFHNMEAPSVLKTDFIAKIHVHRSIHKFSNQKHQQTIHF